MSKKLDESINLSGMCKVEQIGGGITGRKLPDVKSIGL